MEEFHQVMRKVWDVAGSYILPACELEKARVARLDVARDFDVVQSLLPYVEACGQLRVPHASFKRVDLDRVTGIPTSYTFGSRAGFVRFYDKARQAPGKAPEGRVRFEIQAHAGWLSRYGRIHLLGDVTPEAVLRLAEDRWLWSGLGATVVGPEGLQGLLNGIRTNGKRWGPAKTDAFIGYLVLTALGFVRPISPARLAEYNRVQRERGIVMSTVVAGSGARVPTAARRLDFYAGREVAA